ncbi:hypothetical protein AFNJKBDN_CDS0017 [Halorubrum virus V_ICIS4]|nr:hypothetical protein AFNJKBDN_CDS0017 [Halorubrum virus V_ICIS4]
MSDPNRWAVLKEFVERVLVGLLRPAVQGVLLALAVSPALLLALTSRYLLKNHTAIATRYINPASFGIGVGGYILLVIIGILAWSTWQDARENVAGADA